MGGISGVGLGMATAGGVLLWSGLSGVTPVDLAKTLAKGGPAPGINVGSPTQIIRGVLTGSLASVFGQPSGSGGGSNIPGGLGWLPGADQLAFSSSSSSLGARIAQAARAHLGVPYRWGGASPAGWDCSGMVTYVLHHDVGLDLPDNSHTVSQSFLTWSGAQTIPTEQCQAGDLVCWITHIAIATGPSTAVGAENPRVGTIEGPISQLGPGGGETYVIRRVKAQASAASMAV